MNDFIDLQAKIKSIAQSNGEKFEVNERELNAEYIQFNSNQSGITIKILSILGGFLATLAFLGFLAVTGLYETKEVMFLFGLFFIGGAIWLDVVFSTLIIDTLCVCFYLAGYCLLIFSLSAFNVGSNLIAIITATLAIFSLCFTRNYILSFISTIIVCGCFLFLSLNKEYYNFIHLYNALTLFVLTYLFLNEAKIITRFRRISILYDPIRLGLMVSALIGLMFVGKIGILINPNNLFWISSLITIPLTVYLISLIIKVLGVDELKTKIYVYLLSILILLSTATSPAISGSLLILLLSFLVNFRIGFVVGIISFIYFISQFYYDLSFTLLTKSILLFGAGIVFLFFYYFSNKKLVRHDEV